jgi:hypothetical protein
VQSDTQPVAPGKENLVRAENQFGEDCLKILHQHYPSHFWDVFVDFAQAALLAFPSRS